MRTRHAVSVRRGAHATRFNLLRFAPAATCATLVIGACAPDAARITSPDAAGDRAGYTQPGVHRQYGTPVGVGDGMARTYVVRNAKAGQAPVELGVALTASALRALPTSGALTFVLPFPQHTPEPYTFAELDWNPLGHPPVGVYTVPHFDFHFYTISLKQRNSIVPSDPNFAAKANNVPTGAYVPPHYVPLVPPGGTPAMIAVPMMGVHWVNVTSPELHGQQFTSTFIYGSWNGRFIFYEPMITRAYLLTQPAVTMPIEIPQLYPQPGYYPTAYRVSYDATTKEYLVALTGLTRRQ